MIIHRHKDGSQGYEYEMHDMVEIEPVVGSRAWLHGAPGRTGLVVSLDGGEFRSWRNSGLYVRDHQQQAPVRCLPRFLRPTPETMEAARYLMV